MGFGGAMLITLGAMAARRPLPSMAQWPRLAAQASVQALPIVWVVNALVGSIMAFVGLLNMVAFGAIMLVLQWKLALVVFVTVPVLVAASQFSAAKLRDRYQRVQEKAADVKVIDYRMIGATGRVYLTGAESEVRAAAAAAEAALEGVG